MQNPDEYGDDTWCVCKNGFQKRLANGETCPQIIPSGWTTTSAAAPDPTSTSTIPYYSWRQDGAYLSCASASTSTLDILTMAITETYCAGSVSTISPPITYTTSMVPITTGSAYPGNPLFYTESITGSAGYNATAAIFSMQLSFYTAFYSACTESGVTVVSTTTGTSWNTFATLPGGAKGSMTHTTNTDVTFYTCHNQATVTAMPWGIPSKQYANGWDPTGHLEVSITGSQFTADNLINWLWALAYRFAYAVANSLYYANVYHRDDKGFAEIPYPFFQAPKIIEIEYGDSINTGESREFLMGTALFKASEEEIIACKATKDFLMVFEAVSAFVLGPEAGVLIGALDDTLAATVRTAAGSIRNIGASVQSATGKLRNLVNKSNAPVALYLGCSEIEASE